MHSLIDMFIWWFGLPFLWIFLQQGRSLYTLCCQWLLVKWPSVWKWFFDINLELLCRSFLVFMRQVLFVFASTVLMELYNTSDTLISNACILSDKLSTTLSRFGSSNILNSSTSLPKPIHLTGSFSFSWVFQHPLLLVFPWHEIICVPFHSVQSFGRYCTALSNVNFSDTLVYISAFSALIFSALCDFSSSLLS